LPEVEWGFGAVSILLPSIKEAATDAEILGDLWD
jgi:hypothetical protein